MDLLRLIRGGTVEWQVASAFDDRNEATAYTTSIVPGRSQTILKDLFTPSGDVVTARNKVMMLSQPAISDLVNGRAVLEVTEIQDYNAVSIGWMVLTR